MTRPDQIAISSAAAQGVMPVRPWGRPRMLAGLVIMLAGLVIVSFRFAAYVQTPDTARG